MQIIDISRELLGASVYPGDPGPEVRPFSKISEGALSNISVITACAHNATHVDAPLHFFESGDKLISMPLDAFIGPCDVVTFPEGEIFGAKIDDVFPYGCERLLVRGGGKAFFTADGAHALAARGVRLVGTDSQSIGDSSDQQGPHKAFLSHDIPILEGLDLSKVRDGRYFLMAQPLKIDKVEASPVRALLISGPLFWHGGSQV
ncbi:MAG: cyclase family protein [Clostridia bacterium]|nr:cyclase family protein [Clostridia bacterium]